MPLANESCGTVDFPWVRPCSKVPVCLLRASAAPGLSVRGAEPGKSLSIGRCRCPFTGVVMHALLRCFMTRQSMSQSRPSTTQAHYTWENILHEILQYTIAVDRKVIVNVWLLSTLSIAVLSTETLQNTCQMYRRP